MVFKPNESAEKKTIRLENHKKEQDKAELARISQEKAE